MKKPAWNTAPFSKGEKIKSRLKRDRAELGILFEYQSQLGTDGSWFKWRQLPTPASCRPLCSAKTKAGTPCRRRVAIKASGDWGKRCSKHGGYSTGPKTPEGKARQSAAVAQANRARKKERPTIATTPAKVPAAKPQRAAPPSLIELATRELERRAEVEAKLRAQLGADANA